MLHELVGKLQDWWLVEVGAGRLRQLDDRLLADMGIERSEIGRFVRGKLKPGVEVPEPTPVIMIGSPHPRIPLRRRADTAREVDAPGTLAVTRRLGGAK